MIYLLCCRFIVHSDKSNPFLDTLEDLEMELPSFDPSVLVVGGLQMMDNFPFKEGMCHIDSWFNDIEVF